MGSTRFGVTIFLLSNAVAVMYITLAFIGRFVLRDWEGFNSCVVGFSGVLFALLVIFVYQFAVTEAILMAGLIPVPSTAYPWVLLFLFQFLPHASFLCHACGIIVGFAYIHGFMHPFQLSPSKIQSIEQLAVIRSLGRYSGFVQCNENRLPVSSLTPKVAPVKAPSSGTGGNGGITTAGAGAGSGTRNSTGNGANTIGVSGSSALGDMQESLAQPNVIANNSTESNI